MFEKIKELLESRKGLTPIGFVVGVGIILLGVIASMQRFDFFGIGEGTMLTVLLLFSIIAGLVAFWNL